MSNSLRIAMLHPELGLGGSERFVVDAAVALQDLGHRVTLFAAKRSDGQAFDEVRDGTLNVLSYGDHLPIQLAQHLRAPLGIARMSYISWQALRNREFDVVFCDLVSHAISALRPLYRAPLVFYCHFPDRLLTPPRRGLYRLYRWPIDWLEERGIAAADRILVNSQFTAAMLRQTFHRRLAPLQVVWPGIDHTRYDSIAARARGPAATILSVNRFERKKNLGLAIEALEGLRHRLSPQEFATTDLVIAGACDERLAESRQVLRELQDRARELGLEDKVRFLCSVSEAERLRLLESCTAVVYTPDREHFGIVPLEAMAAARPVVAVRSGGVLETVRHGETGLLCEPTPEAFADALARLIKDRNEAARFGAAGREHVEQTFSRRAFGERLQAALRQAVASTARPETAC